MKGLKIIYTEDWRGTRYPRYLRNESGVLCTFRGLNYYPGQDERYKKEITEINELAELCKKALEGTKFDKVINEHVNHAFKNEDFNPLQPYEVYIEDGEIKHRNVDIR